MTIDGRRTETPLFLPVYQPGNPYVIARELQDVFGARGIITNGFLLYKQRILRETLPEQTVQAYLDFDRLIVTDSGAFQALRGPLYLSNKNIVRFQDAIGADVISPLDLITTPGDSFPVAEKKLNSTLKRIRKALNMAERSVLIGVQQGGRFLQLRERAVKALVEMDVSYLALGSLVPFFNRRHDLSFTGAVIRQARALTPPDVPIHLYGAGDPVELPFYAALGCDVFDSSAWVHYGRDNYFMTPYGALQGRAAMLESGYACGCPVCAEDSDAVWGSEIPLVHHNLWVTLETVREVRERLRAGTLDDYLANVLDVHGAWFGEESDLVETWKSLHES